MPIIYEVDLRSREDGSSYRCFISTEKHDEAYTVAEVWNKANIDDYDSNLSVDYYIDNSDGYVADVIECDEYTCFGIGLISERLKIRNIANGVCEKLFMDDIKSTEKLVEIIDKLTNNAYTEVKQYITFYNENCYTFRNFREILGWKLKYNDVWSDKDFINELNKSVFKLYDEKLLWVFNN